MLATRIATKEEAAAAEAKQAAERAAVSTKTIAARKLIRSTHYRHVSGKGKQITIDCSFNSIGFVGCGCIQFQLK